MAEDGIQKAERRRGSTRGRRFVAAVALAMAAVELAPADGATLTWTGTAGSAWDVGVTANWWDNGQAKVYANGDTVNFVDGPANRGVVLAGMLTPAGVIVDSAVGNDYTFGGGTLGGAAAFLAKDGTSTLTLLTNNTYGGATTVNAGTVQVGNGGSASTLGTGPVNVRGRLVFNRADSFTVANAIGDVAAFAGQPVVAGTVVKMGAGTLTLSSTASTFTGNFDVQAGTVRVTNSNSLGATTGGNVTVGAGATLDLSGNSTLNGLDFGLKQFHIRGAGDGTRGAIYYGGTVSQINALQVVTLDADATVNATGRFDIRGGAPAGTPPVYTARLNLGNNTLTKTGDDQFSLVHADVTGDGDIVVERGTFSIETTTRIPTSATGRIIYRPGTVAQFYNNTTAPGTADSLVVRQMVAEGALTMGNAGTGTATIGSNVELHGPLTIADLDRATVSTRLTLTGDITQNGTPRGVIKNGVHTVVLSGNNTFTGGVAINRGTVVVGSAGALNASGANTVAFGVDAAGGARLVLNGNSIAVAGLSTATLPVSEAIVENASATSATLTISSAVDTRFGGILRDGAGGGTLSLTKAGAGTVELREVDVHGALNVLGGTLKLPAPGGLNAFGSLTVAGGRIDLTTGSMTVADPTGDGSVSEAVRGYLASAFDGGRWDGATGIGTSAAAATGFIGTLGFRPGAGVVAVGYTLPGDADLDRDVDAADYAALVAGVQRAAGSATWSDGDFNYDRVVNGDDWALFNLGAAVGSVPVPPTVPEPVAAWVGVVPAAAWIGRRRRRRP